MYVFEWHVCLSGVYMCFFGMCACVYVCFSCV